MSWCYWGIKVFWIEKITRLPSFSLSAGGIQCRTHKKEDFSNYCCLSKTPQNSQHDRRNRIIQEVIITLEQILLTKSPVEIDGSSLKDLWHHTQYVPLLWVLSKSNHSAHSLADLKLTCGSYRLIIRECSAAGTQFVSQQRDSLDSR